MGGRLEGVTFDWSELPVSNPQKNNFILVCGGFPFEADVEKEELVYSRL